MVYDLGKIDSKTNGYDREPVVQSTIRTGKHMDPVWQVRWSQEDSSGVVSFVSISTDGTMIQWSITTNELQVEELMKFKLLLKDDDADIDETDVVGQASTNCFAFSRDSSNLFVVGTEEGHIHKCSKAYNSQYLETYKAHQMAVYTVQVSEW
jgi:dynein intermediate chain 1